MPHLCLTSSAAQLLAMPQPAHTISTTSTVLLILLLSVSFFPGLFHHLWTSPFRLFAPVDSIPAPNPAETSAPDYANKMTWFQKQFTLPAKSRGSYLITDQVVSQLPEIREYKVGLLNLFVQHTSCALSLNENCTFHIHQMFASVETDID